MTESKATFEVRLLGGTESKRTKRSSVNSGTTKDSPLLTCLDCGEIKPRSQFYNSSYNKNGKQTYCRACHIVRLGDDPARVNVQGPDRKFRGDQPIVEVKPSEERTSTGTLCINTALADKVRTEYRNRMGIADGISLCKWEIVHAVLAEWIGGDA